MRDGGAQLDHKHLTHIGSTLYTVESLKNNLVCYEFDYSDVALSPMKNNLIIINKSFNKYE